MRECQRVHKNDCGKCARDSVASDRSCAAWLNDGLARCECLEWCQVTVNDLTGMQQQQQEVPLLAARAPMPARRPSGLVMVHAMLTLADNVWLCGMIRI